jgi:cytochrome c oxidase assembly factor CtaG
MTVSWHVALFDWQTDALSLFGLGLEVALAALYGFALLRARRGARAWSPWRTAAFMAGLFSLMMSLQSGFARYDDIYWVHVVQHQVLMSLAPALLVLGAPLMLLLKVLPADRARRLVGVLRSRGLNWMNSPSAAIHLPLHYYGVMYLYLLTPAYALGQRSAMFHEFVHVYFIGCGLMFWLPVLGQYPSRWHPAHRTKLLMVGAGLPINLALAGLAAGSTPIDATRSETVVGVWALVAGSVFCTTIGIGLVRGLGARRHERRPQVQVGVMPGTAAMVASRRA